MLPTSTRATTSPEVRSRRKPTRASTSGSSGTVTVCRAHGWPSLERAMGRLRSVITQTGYAVLVIPGRSIRDKNPVKGPPEDTEESPIVLTNQPAVSCRTHQGPRDARRRRHRGNRARRRHGSPAAHAATTSNASYFVNAINKQRVAHHRPKLAVSSEMNAAALRWASQMAKSNTLAHNPKLASSVSNWRYLGENVGVGYSDSSLEAAFYASPHHRDNMLDTDFTQIGVAVVVVKGKMWVAEEFRRPMHSTASSAKAKSHHKTAQVDEAQGDQAQAKKVDLASAAVARWSRSCSGCCTSRPTACTARRPRPPCRTSSATTT